MADIELAHHTHIHKRQLDTLIYKSVKQFVFSQIFVSKLCLMFDLVRVCYSFVICVSELT